MNASRTARSLAVISLTVLGAEGRAEDAPPFRVTSGEVRVVCPLTVGGSFEARATSFSGTVALATPRPPAFEGDLTVDLRTLDTGIELRNHHMRDTYLEVGKGAGYDTAVLSDIHLGDIDAATFQGRTPFTATLLLHAARKPVGGDADIKREGSDVRVAARFPVRLDEFGIEPPRYLGVGVKNEVQVSISFVATPTPPSSGE
jgi:polyisoprenoid-binding protein YceI